MAGFDNYFRPSGVVYNSQGAVTGATPTYNNAIQNTRDYQSGQAGVQNTFQSAHPGATSMTTGQLYGVGAPNTSAPSYDQIKKNYYNSWGNGTDANAAAGWDTWKRNFLSGGPGVSVGGNTTNQGGAMPTTPAGNAAAYGAGYTGFGNSNLTASGNPDYNGGSGNGGPGGGGSGGNGGSTPYFYSGPDSVMPWVTHPTTAPTTVAGAPVLRNTATPTVTTSTTPTSPATIANRFAPVIPRGR